MNKVSHSMMLRNLSKDYYQRHISFEEYRRQRKIVLDKIDEEFNGRKIQGLPAEESESLSLSMNTIAFFNDSDVDK